MSVPWLEVSCVIDLLRRMPLLILSLPSFLVPGFFGLVRPFQPVAVYTDSRPEPIIQEAALLGEENSTSRIGVLNSLR